MFREFCTGIACGLLAALVLGILFALVTGMIPLTAGESWDGAYSGVRGAPFLEVQLPSLVVMALLAAVALGLFFNRSSRTSMR